MKTVLTAILMVVALASPALAQHTVPFRGTLEATEVDTGFTPPVSALKRLEGTGKATHLGKFTLVTEFAVNITNATARGTVTITAANGDVLIGTTTGRATVTNGIANITETWTITDGSGRFTGTIGTIVVTRVLDLATGVSAAVMSGVIEFGH